VQVVARDVRVRDDDARQRAASALQTRRAWLAEAEKTLADLTN